jgi:hypothetical protein
MASIEIRGQELLVHIHGWDMVRAMRSTVTVPLVHIAAVRAHPEEAEFDDVIVDSWRGIGTYQPGHLAAGTLNLADGRSFFHVRHRENVIAIDLQRERLAHIVVELDDEKPEDAVSRITEARRLAIEAMKNVD